METRNKRITLYLAARLFNAAERLHNLALEKFLKELGYEIILPQREATKFIKGNVVDLIGIRKDCEKYSKSREVILVGNIDGPDADSGTCVEYAYAIASTGRAILYRTDFSAALDREVGVNAMLCAEGTRFIYFPCYTLTEGDQIEGYYKELAQKIHKEVMVIIDKFIEKIPTK